MTTAEQQLWISSWLDRVTTGEATMSQRSLVSIDGQKPIAAICHGPQLLIAAGGVKGRTLTAQADVRAELQRTGAKVKDEVLVTDGPWITSRRPEALPKFCAAIVAQFEVNADQSWAAHGGVHPES